MNKEAQEKIAEQAYREGCAFAVKEALYGLAQASNLWNSYKRSPESFREQPAPAAYTPSLLEKGLGALKQYNETARSFTGELGATPTPKELRSFAMRGTDTSHTYNDSDLDKPMDANNFQRRFQRYAPELFDSSLRAARKTFLPPPLQGDAALSSFDDITTNIADNAYGAFGDIFGVRGGVSD